MGSEPASSENPRSEDFEEFVAAALKVDPKGLSGKHRKTCAGVLIVHGPNDPVGCEFGDGCAARELEGEALVHAHPKQVPDWIANAT